MVKFFMKKFLSKGPEGNRTSIGQLAGVLGFLSNAILFIGKFAIGVMAHSVSIMADAINSLTDTISSVLTLVGFKIAAKPADKEHPYGHERFEYISGFLISLIMTFVGWQFLQASFGKILQPEKVKLNWLVFVVLLLSIAIKVWQSRMYQSLARSIQSKTLQATSQDSLNDVLTTVAVLLSAIVEWFTGWRVDGYVGFLIALYIIYSGIKMVMEFIAELLGQRPNEEELEQMNALLGEYPEILGYHDLLVHNYGPQKRFASVHIEVDDRWSLNQAHEVINQIEKDFLEQLDVSLVCHIDPVAVQDADFQEKRRTIEAIVANVDERLRMHDFRVISPESISFDLVVPKTVQLSDQELADTIRLKIHQRYGNQKIEITFDHNYLLPE